MTFGTKTITVRFEGETAEGFHAKRVNETHDLTDADILTINGNTLTFERKPNTFVQLNKKA